MVKDMTFDRNIPIAPIETKNGRKNNLENPWIEFFTNKKSLFLCAMNTPLSNKNTQEKTTEEINIKEYKGDFRIDNFGAKKSIKRMKTKDKIAEIVIENKKDVEINLFLFSELIEGRNLIKVGLNPDVEKTVNKVITEINADAKPTSSGEYKRAATNQNKNPVIPTTILESIR